jgi:hypothetical protein
MKKITFLVLTLITTTFFGQDKLTSSLSEFFDGSSWTPFNTSEFTYDNDNNLTEIIDLDWDIGTSQWIKFGVATYTYNANNKSVVELYQEYNGSAIQYQYRVSNTYNSEGFLIQILEEDYLTSSWVKAFNINLEYANGNIVSGISSEWNGVDWIIGEDSSKLRIDYNANGTVSSVVTDLWESSSSSWLAANRSVYSYDGNNRIVLQEGQVFEGSAWMPSYKTEYAYDANGNALTEKEFYKDNGVFILENEETNTFDTLQLMANFAHPFKDKRGVDYLFSVNGIINKILTTTSGDSRTTYNYGEATASIPKFNLADVAVSPNPVNDVLSIRIQNISIHKIEVYNLLGKKVLTSTKSKINVENLPKGVYLLKIQSEDAGFVTKRMLKN